MAVPLSRTNLSKADLSKAELGSERDPSGLKRSKSAVRLGEDEETVVVDVTRLHRKEVRGWAVDRLTRDDNCTRTAGCVGVSVCVCR